jgi:addiction module RelE/StbE family toxin
MPYNLQYLPRFQKDLEEITNYITFTLEAPRAALDLAQAAKAACARLCDFPFAHHRFIPKKPLKHEYRMLPVKNFVVFYTVIDNAVFVHRMLYGKRNFSALLD